jgi:hypothetical protein
VIGERSEAAIKQEINNQLSFLFNQNWISQILVSINLKCKLISGTFQAILSVDLLLIHASI